MEHPKKELIEGIADLFEDYEEAYVPGEWEAFSAPRKKKYPFLGQWVKIAAVLLLILSVLVFSLSDDSKQQTELVGVKPQVQHAGKGDSIAASKGGVTLPAAAGVEAADRTVESNSSTTGVKPGAALTHSVAKNGAAPAIGIDLGPKEQKGFGTDTAVVIAKSPIYAQNTGAVEPLKKAIATDTVVVLENNKLSTIDFLIAESKNPAKEQKKKDLGSKWDFGVEVMPTVTQKNMNVGAGLTTAYRLSNKLSISSGISLLQLQSGVNVGNAGGIDMSVARSLSDRQLTAVNSNIKAVDIPLGLVYKINQHFYTSAGVSYFNVINEKRSNTYLQTAQVSQSVSNAVTGDSYSYKAVVSEQVSEPVDSEPLRGNSYLGFFNFSIGRKQTLFNKYNIMIEPFIKVPVGKLSDQELKLLNSGLKLQLSF